MSDDLQRTRMIAAIRKECTVIIRELDEALKPLLKSLEEALPMHRLSQIANSLAWHERRPAPAERLNEGARELARLWHKVGGADSAEGKLYLLLLNKLGMGAEIRDVQEHLRSRIADLEATISGNPKMSKNEQKQISRVIKIIRAEIQIYSDVEQQLKGQEDQRSWAAHIHHRLIEAELTAQLPLARLLLALAAIQGIQTLQRSTELRDSIASHGGALVW